MRRGQEFGDNHGNGKPKTAVGKRVFPDLPVPPDQLPPDDDRDAYRKAQVIVQVWGEPNVTKTVYLRLFDPDDPNVLGTTEMKLTLFAEGTTTERMGKASPETQKTKRRLQLAKLLKPVAVGCFETYPQGVNLDASIVVAGDVFCFARLTFCLRSAIANERERCTAKR